MATNRFLPEVLKSRAFGSITGTYAIIGLATQNPGVLVSFINTTDVTLMVSWDGVNDHMVLVANSFQLFDVVANDLPTEQRSIAKNTSFYVKHAGAAPSSGAMYVELFYGG